MDQRMPRFRALAILVAALGLGFFALWRSRIFAASNDPAAQLVDRGRSAYRQVEMSRIQELESSAQVLAILDRALAGDQAGDRAPAELLQAVSEFIYYRFSQDSVQQYKDWRHASGYRMVPAEEMRKTWFIDSDYEAIFDQPYPGDASLEQVFDRFWERWREGIVAVASEPRGICVTLGKVTREQPRQWPRLECELTSALWHGMKSAAKRGWWQGSRSLADVLNDDGEAQVALVGIVIESEAGNRQPYHFGYFFDPLTKTWRLFMVNTANYDDPGTPLEF